MTVENWNPNTAGPECDWCGECDWCQNLHLSTNEHQHTWVWIQGTRVVFRGVVSQMVKCSDDDCDETGYLIEDGQVAQADR